MWWIRGGILALSAASMLWLSVGLHDVFASPDERANAFFSQAFAENFQLCAPEPLNILAQGLIHPRSTVAPGTCILPASFLGFPVLNGVVMMVFGVFGSSIASIASMLFAPCLATLGLFAWWWLVRRLSRDEVLADLGALFVLLHPAWWYYGARVMMHNVPFVALMMIASALFIVAHDRRSIWFGGVSGMILALALSFRLVELPLVAIVCAVLLVCFWKKIHWRAWYREPTLHAILGAVLTLVGYLVINHAVYGAWFSTGYNLPDLREVAEGSSGVSSEESLFSRLLPFVLPFGFHPRAILRNVLEYGVGLYPVLSVMALIGMGCVWRAGRGWRIGVGVLLGAACWMAVVYGSWLVVDNIDPNAVTVGNSHVRYWLPLFVAASVFAAYPLRALMHRSWIGRYVVLGTVLAITISSARTVFGGTDGLWKTRAALAMYEDTRTEIIEAASCTEGGDTRPVIVVDHADKYLFPDCRVIVPLRSDATYAILPTLIDVVPLYYFGLTLPESDLSYLNEVKLPSLHLRIEFVKTIGDQSLYRFSREEDGGKGVE